MKLNNEITLKKNELERINDEKNKLKNEEEDENKKKFGKYSELAQILMAINDMEVSCKTREMDKKIKYNRKSNVQKVEYEDPPKNFNDPRKRVDYAKAQMNAIKKYLSGYIKIMNEMRINPSISDHLNNLKNNQELI